MQEKFERIFSYCKIGTSRSVFHFEKSTLKRFIADENYSLLPDPRDHCVWIDYFGSPASKEHLKDEQRESLPNPFQVVNPKFGGQRTGVGLKQRPEEASTATIYQPVSHGGRKEGISPAKISFKQLSLQNAELVKESIAQKSYSRPR